MAKIVVSPERVHLVFFDAGRIAELSADVADRVGLASDIEVRIEVDERVPLGRVRVMSLDPITIAVEGGAFEDAKHHLDICQELGGSNDAIDLERMLLLVQQGDLSGLDRSLKQRADQDSAETPLILEALAQGYLRTYDLRAALDCIRRLLERQPRHVQALLWHAQAMEHLNRRDEAAADYRQALQIDPDEKWARLSLGDVLLQRHQPREALQRQIHVALDGVDRGDHFEAEIPQHRGNVLRVVSGVRQRDVRGFVIGVADHQGNAPFRPRVGARRNHDDCAHDRSSYP